MDTCKRCGVPFTPKRKAGRKQLFCSRFCVKKYWNDICNPLQPRKTDKRRGTVARRTNFSESELNLLWGMVLGDGSLIINPQGNNRLSITQGEKQLPYLLWKIEKISFIFHKHKRSPSRCESKGRVFYVAGSVWHPYLNSIRHLFYLNGKKLIPRDERIISPETLAIWYMDDGWFNRNPNSMQSGLSTHCYSVSDVDYLRTSLHKRYGINSSIYMAKGKYPSLTILRSTLNKFFELIRPHIHPLMAYKIL